MQQTRWNWKNTQKNKWFNDINNKPCASWDSLWEIRVARLAKKNKMNLEKKRKEKFQIIIFFLHISFHPSLSIIWFGEGTTEKEQFKKKTYSLLLHI